MRFKNYLVEMSVKQAKLLGNSILTFKGGIDGLRKGDYRFKGYNSNIAKTILNKVPESNYINGDGEGDDIIVLKEMSTENLYKIYNTSINILGGKMFTKFRRRSTPNAREEITLSMFALAAKGVNLHYNFEDEEILLRKLEKDYNSSEGFNSGFYRIAVLSADAAAKAGKSFRKATVFEMDKGTYSSKINNHVTSLIGSSADNWNPADIWIFSDAGIDWIDGVMGDITDLSLINSELYRMLMSNDIFPISLKYPENTTKMRFRLNQKYPIPTDEKIAFDEITMPLSLNSLSMKAKNKFAIQIQGDNIKGHYLAHSANLETSGGNHGVGTPYGKLWFDYVQSNDKRGKGILSIAKPKAPYKTQIGDVSESDFLLWRESYVRLSKMSGKGAKTAAKVILFKYEDLDENMLKRYVRNASWLEFLLDNKKDVLKIAYESSKKIGRGSNIDLIGAHYILD